MLFLDSIQQSVERVAFRTIEQNGLVISGDNIKINFNESFKNVAQYFFYFDQSNFIYTGVTGTNAHIMSFNKSTLEQYNSNDLQYPQKFAAYSFQHHHLNQDAFSTITSNKDFKHTEPQRKLKTAKGRRRLK